MLEKRAPEPLGCWLCCRPVAGLRVQSIADAKSQVLDGDTARPGQPMP